jgi:ABC-type Fe3+-hydroxamate transport system substrate-binding protein
MILDLGVRLGAEERARDLVDRSRAALEAPLPQGPRPRVFTAVWHEPLMGLGSESYGHDFLERCGAENVLRSRPRYPELSLDELHILSPDLILLPDEPFPFAEKHLAVYNTVTSARIVDGKLLWWYGCRIPEAIARVRSILTEVE